MSIYIKLMLTVGRLHSLTKLWFAALVCVALAMCAMWVGFKIFARGHVPVSGDNIKCQALN